MAGPSTTTVKFLCSYGGKILPRYPDGKLRYYGGHTRVLSIDRSVSFSELMVKLVELCGASVSLRCQLPSEDLDALITITSDEDLANIIEEYDKAAAAAAVKPSELKIRAFLWPPRSAKKVTVTSSPPPLVLSPFSSVTYSGSSYSSKSASRCPAPMATNRCYRPRSPAPTPIYEKISGRNTPPYGYLGSPSAAAANVGGRDGCGHVIWSITATTGNS